MDKFEFIGTPVAKPRMTRADRYKKRPVVEKYWAFKDMIKLQAKQQKFKLADEYSVVFVMPIAKSTSEKKKAEMYGEPHRLRPDLDNMLKSLNDCLMDEDSSVHNVHARKIWGYEGKIVVENLT